MSFNFAKTDKINCSYIFLENKVDQLKNYLLVMEYANGGTLRNYLKRDFNILTWDNKFSLAYQLACALSCLHDERIVHRDLVITFKIIKPLFTTNLLLFVYYNSIPIM